MKISNVWCVGRNYVDHAKELNNPIPQTPLIFLKSADCITTDSQIALPTWTDDVHHECELAVQIDHDGQPIALALALDLTARSVQAELKKKGEPWTLAKSFRDACPMGPLVSFPKNFESLTFQLKKNNKIVQQGAVSDMIFSLERLIEHLKSHFPIQPGDIVLTGTPAGVGPLKKGDILEAQIEGITKMLWTIH